MFMLCEENESPKRVYHMFMLCEENESPKRV